MCTAATYKTKDFYFGRTLDNEFSYGDEIVVTPRNYCLHFQSMGSMESHYAMIGMAHVVDDCPLYYEAVNEKGLGMAGLNFVGNAQYRDPVEGKDNVPSFEFIPWILSQCVTVKEARVLLEKINIDNRTVNDELPAASLHWIIADSTEAITVESVKEGINVYDNPVGVLTNNPPFNLQMFALNNYMALSVKDPVNNFAPSIPLDMYCKGMGAIGLPGDWSSESRFVKASFVKMNSVSGDSEMESVNQFFHILGSVNWPKGCCLVREGEYEITTYTCCCNADKGIYYYTSYDNHQISAVDMYKEDLEGTGIYRYSPVHGEQIHMQN